MSATPAASTPLDLRGELPSGTVVLEASAGTGKTYAIAALVTRAVAEGRCTLPELLVVTFTRAATAELRDRIRGRLVEATDHLAARLADVRAGRPTTPTDDDVLDHLADGDDLDVLALRHERLAAAVADFDAATISTIHGFTQQVLRTVGLSADVRRDVQLLEDPAPLLDEVVDDVRLRRYLDHVPDPDDPTGFPRPSRANLHAIATAVVNRSDAAIVPEVTDDHPLAAELAAAARELRTQTAARKRRAGVLGYDDLLTSLRDALEHPERGDEAVAVLRERYRWALVDEFQDTDPVQWDILDRAFRDPSDPGRALVLIGDPKQAIYGFRGADVRAYLEATAAADQRHTLPTNWRSDQLLVTALDRLLTGTRFGDAGITFREVTAAPRHAGSALADDADPAALQLRVVRAAPGGTAAPAIRQHVADDVAATVVAQLRDVQLGRTEPRPVEPRQLAVLVRTNAEATQVQSALRAVGVPAVVNGVGSVLRTDAADDWRWLLQALERPADPARARRFAVSGWCGWNAARLAGATDEAWDELHGHLHAWSRVLRDHGVATLLRVVLARLDTAARLLAVEGGERHLTDLRHVGELLHTAEREDERGVTALLSWLLASCAEADAVTPSDEQARRLESDADAVQIVTVHRSKGLEYDIVLCPYLWSGGQSVQAPLTVHVPGHGRRLIDVGPKDRPGFQEHQELARAEAAGEALRLLYVAVTRARHRAVVWWARVGGCDRSALARVLFGRDDRGEVTLAERVALPPADEDVSWLDTAYAVADHTSVTEVPVELTHEGWEAAPPASATLAARSFERTLDLAWQRTSYSGLTARAERLERRSLVTTEPADRVTDDEPDGHGGPPADDTGGRDDLPAELAERLRRHPLPLGELVGGAQVGTMVHAVLEHTDFAAADLDAELDTAIADQERRHRLGLDPLLLRAGLHAAITAPLGELAGTVDGGDGRPRDRTLRDVARRDRLDEVDFELPLAGGDRGGRDGARVTLARLADLLDQHLPADDPLARHGYAERLRRPGYHLELRGYLAGSIDLVLRVPAVSSGSDGAHGQGHRYLVVDHKTNRLGWPDPPTALDYRPSALAAAMVHGDYPLQALLYQVALHRYLRWRQPGYDPAVHLGGVLYLFLRGMTGPATPRVDGAPCGVFAWTPPPALVTGLSDLLDGVDGEVAT